MVKAALLLALCTAPLFAQGRNYTPPSAPTDVVPGSITNEDVPYPHPVHYLPLTLYGQDVRMAYMDVPPTGPANGRTVLLFHGFNFGGFYFANVIEALNKEGFRVVATDQIGFGRSSKPIIPYNLTDMAMNSRKVLESLGIARAAVVGHSMGGMLAARFAALFPDITERVVLYDPIGLTDTRYSSGGGGRGRSADDAYKAAMAQTQDQAYQAAYATIRRYFETDWKEDYASYARIMYAPTLSADAPRLNMVRALLGQMIQNDPVVYDWAHIKVKALVLGGDKDGPDFPAQAKHIADTIPGGQLVLIPGVGHVPHIQVPEIFNRELLKFLRSDAAGSPQSTR